MQERMASIQNVGGVKIDGDELWMGRFVGGGGAWCGAGVAWNHGMGE